MHRLSNGSQVPTLPTPVTASGTPGFATRGVPGVQSPSIIDPDAYNAQQEEIIAVVLAAGIGLDKTNNAQLLQALRALFRGQGGGSFGPAGTLGNVGVTQWTVPAGVTRVRVRCWGAGGGGGGSQASPSAASGGGGGGYAEGVYTVTPGQVIAVTAGVGGSGGGAGTTLAGGSGGSSSFGTFCTATGGTQGLGAATSGYQANAGAAGTPTGGNILNIVGTNGQAGFGLGGLGLGGGGGGAFCGPGSPPTPGSATNGVTPGGGGAGGANGGSGGQAGTGIVLVEW